MNAWTNRVANGLSALGYRRGEAVIIVDELPKTSTGKIQKNVVRKQFAGWYSSHTVE